QFLHGLREHLRMLLVVALESHREVEHGLLQQAALGAHLVGGDRLELRAERGVEDAHVRRGRLVALRRERIASGEERDGRAREKEPRLAEKCATGRKRVRRVTEIEKRHLIYAFGCVDANQAAGACSLVNRASTAAETPSARFRARAKAAS